MSNFESVLKLEKLVFDEISFERKGFRQNNEASITFSTRVLQSKTDADLHCVRLKLNSVKKNEYEINICLSGYFSVKLSDGISQQEVNQLLSKNAVAILMPYIRSELSLLTAQPETDCVVLPPFNINKMMEDAIKENG